MAPGEPPRTVDVEGVTYADLHAELTLDFRREVNRPGCFGRVQAFIKCALCFGWADIADGAVQRRANRPLYPQRPFQGPKCPLLAPSSARAIQVEMRRSPPRTTVARRRKEGGQFGATEGMFDAASAVGIVLVLSIRPLA